MTAWPRRIPKSLVLVLADMARANPPLSSAFVAEFARRLQGQSPSLALPLTWLEQRLAEYGLTIEQLVQSESQNQAADQVSISNSIGSLRFLGAMDWREFVETLSGSSSAARRTRPTLRANGFRHARPLPPRRREDREAQPSAGERGGAHRRSHWRTKRPPANGRATTGRRTSALPDRQGPAASNARRSMRWSAARLLARSAGDSADRSMPARSLCHGGYHRRSSVRSGACRRGLGWTAGAGRHRSLLLRAASWPSRW